MKYIILLCFLLLSFVTSCAEPEDLEEQEPFYPLVEISDSIDNETENDTIICSFEKYMDLQPAASSVQGSACYGDFFVQGYNYNSCVTIYNLKEKKCLGTIDISAPTPSAKTHSNTLNFGNQRYDSNDYFPLLYISSGYQTNGVSHIYVYRLTKNVLNDKESFSISLVQTISLHLNGWTEGIVDSTSDYIWIKYGLPEQYGFALYKLPNIFDGDVEFYYEDNLKDFRLDRTPKGSRNQGHLYRDGKIFLVTGVPSSGEQIAFISIDTEKEVRDLIIDLVGAGLVNPNNPRDNTFEPEGVIIYNDQLMICYPTALYTFTFKKKHEESTNIKTLQEDVCSTNNSIRGVYELLGNKRSGTKGILIMQEDNTYRKIIIR